LSVERGLKKERRQRGDSGILLVGKVTKLCGKTQVLIISTQGERTARRGFATNQLKKVSHKSSADWN